MDYVDFEKDSLNVIRILENYYIKQDPKAIKEWFSGFCKKHCGLGIGETFKDNRNVILTTYLRHTPIQLDLCYTNNEADTDMGDGYIMGIEIVVFNNNVCGYILKPLKE
jgi:hypothetical protein